MDNNEYQTVGLYNHNANSYNQVKSSFESENDVVAIVHATGTGKTFNALQLAYDNKDKKNSICCTIKWNNRTYKSNN